MTKQKPWDRYESVVLLEAYIKVSDGLLERNKAIREVSSILRKKAENDGEAIDEIYRNVAGITFQMYSMESAYQGYTIRKPATKLFKEIVDMRMNNRKQYDTLLKEAEQMFFTVDKRAEYQDWLVKVGLQYQAARNYGNWLNNLDTYALDNGYSNKSVYEMSEVTELVKLCELLSTDEKFVSSHRDCLTSLRKYIVYKSNGEIHLGRTRTVRDISTNQYRVEYQDWLVANGMQEAAARNYGNWLNNLDNYALNNGYSNKSVYEILEVTELVKLCELLNGDENFVNSHRDCLTSLRKYIVYKSDGEIHLGRTRTVRDISTNQYRVEYQDWLVTNGMQETAARNYGNWLSNIAYYTQEKGVCEKNIYEIDDANELVSIYERLLLDEELINTHRDYMTSFRKYISYKSNGEIQLSRTRAAMRKVYNQLSNNGDYNVEDSLIKKEYPELYMRLKSMAKVYDDDSIFSLERIYTMIGIVIEQSQFKEILDKLSWISNEGNNTYSFSKKAEPMEKMIPFDKESFIRVLMMRYQNGMRFDSIDLENFRETYEDIVGDVIILSDSDLELCLRECGVVYQNRIFPAEGIINSNARIKLLDYIRTSFERGKQVLYYKSIYADLLDDFAYCFNLSDENMLRAYLRCDSELSEYFFFEEFMSVDNNVVINHTEEIEEFFLTKGKPLSYEEVYVGLSHISRDIIYNEIKTNTNIILNEKEHYYHYGNFEFSSEDADKITEFVSKAIDEDGYCIWSRVFKKIQESMPLFIENNIYLSSLGIRNAIARKLSGRFNFSGEVICNRGIELNMSAVYRLYGEHYAPFNDNDIYEFSKEVSGGVIYFDSLSESTIRVSKTLFVQKENVYFDIEMIDNALATYLQTGYMLIKDIDSFLVFPNVGYEWNAYLLESYLMYYSDKYSLLNNGRSLNNVAGVLVRKGTGYDEFVDVCADVLANSGCALTKEKALNYLAEQNILTRRSYSRIDEAIIRARQIVNKKG